MDQMIRLFLFSVFIIFYYYLNPINAQIASPAPWSLNQFIIEYTSPLNSPNNINKLYLSYSGSPNNRVQVLSSYDASNPSKYIWKWIPIDPNTPSNHDGRITALSANQCIDIWGGDSGDGAFIDTQQCGNSNFPFQLWSIRNNLNSNNNPDNGVMIQFASINVQIKQCLRIRDVNGGDVLISLLLCNDNNKNQYFKFIPVPVLDNLEIRNANNNNNNNNALLSLTPSFSAFTTSYTMTVGADVESININTVLANLLSVQYTIGDNNNIIIINTPSFVSLNVGENIIKITVAPQNNPSSSSLFTVYTLIITRQQPSTPIPTTASFESIGCIQDVATNGDILSSVAQSSPPVTGWTVQSCIDRAYSLGKAYAALRNGNQCYVTNNLFSMGKSTIASSSQCSAVCSDNLSCGGAGFSSLFFSVYLVKKTFSVSPGDASTGSDFRGYTAINAGTVSTAPVSGWINEISIAFCDGRPTDSSTKSVTLSLIIVNATEDVRTFSLASRITKTITVTSTVGYQSFSMSDTPLWIDAGQRLGIFNREDSGITLCSAAVGAGTTYYVRMDYTTAGILWFNYHANWYNAYQYKVTPDSRSLFTKLVDLKVKNNDNTFISATPISSNSFAYIAPSSTAALTFSSVVPDPNRVSITTNDFPLTNYPISFGITKINVNLTTNSFIHPYSIRIRRTLPQFLIQWRSPSDNNIKRYLSFVGGNTQSIRFLPFDFSNAQKFLWQWTNNGGVTDIYASGQLQSLTAVQCIDVWAGNSANGAVMGTYACGDSNPNQKWFLRRINNSNNNNNGNYKQMIQWVTVNDMIQKCLSLPTGITIDNNNNNNNQEILLTISDCNNNDPNQLFNFIDSVSF